jgi:hypothetical protein
LDYPAPDRSDQTPDLTKSTEDGVLDIGWFTGALGDGRPFRAECWAQDGITVLTFFLSTVGLESLERAQLIELLQREGLVVWQGETRFLGVAKILDASQHELWSLNVVIGDENELYAESPFSLQRYGQD